MSEVLKLSSLKGSTLLISKDGRLCSAVVIQCDIKHYVHKEWRIAKKNACEGKVSYSMGKLVNLGK